MLAGDTEANGLTGLKGLKTAVNNGAVFTADKGFETDGAATYVDVDFVQATDGVNVTQNDNVSGVYIGRNLQTGNRGQPYGVSQSGITTTSIRRLRDLNDLRALANSVGNQDRINQDFEEFALHSIGRTTNAAADSKYKVNGINRGGDGASAVSLATIPFWIGGQNFDSVLNEPWPGDISLFFAAAAVGFDDVGFSDAVHRMLKQINPSEFAS